MGAGALERAIAAVRAGEPVLVPTDGVYGLCASPYGEAPVRRLYALKGRAGQRPAAILAASLEVLFELVPELRGRSELVARALLPGPYTLVLPNPARRFGWLCGDTPEAIGVRVALVPAVSQALLDAVGALAATSANPAGEPAPARLADVEGALRARCGAELDGGSLPGTASTVLDFSGAEPAVLREGAGAVPEALARVRDALGRPPAG